MSSETQPSSTFERIESNLVWLFLPYLRAGDEAGFNRAVAANRQLLKWDGRIIDRAVEKARQQYTEERGA